MRLTCRPHRAMAHLSVIPTTDDKFDSTPIWAVGRVRLEAQVMGLNSVWARNATAVFGPNADDR